ncbi:hypothetical protein PFISCL1PPCAC_2862 [Pristionchus fissidentatus]|uniref:Uncharacterized protein n=1 Tax=Pristionchus fissidentatus TaxID=1538716 RepID=A0AAV5V177_9BILA|nr:hypothetical protein PFISCL1PPCAC_2862 [Pristionchus fissidentatus]
METVEIQDDAILACEEPSPVDIVAIVSPEEAIMELAVPDDQEEAMPDAMEAARCEDDAVMEHTGQGGDDAAIDMDAVSLPGVDETMVDADDGNTRDTLPMYDEEVGVVAATTGTSDGASSADAEMKDESPSTEGDSSQSIPENNGETPTEQLPAATVPSTFPHCSVCGFDRETVLMKEKKGNSGVYKNKVIYRNRCVRKPCARFFGPYYIWDGKAAEFVRSAEESNKGNRPFAAAPREEKYPDIDYERAVESGIRWPIDTYGAWKRESGKFAAAQATRSGSDTPSSSTPVASSTPNGTASPVVASAAVAVKTMVAAAARVAARAPSAAAAAKTKAAAAKKLRKGYKWVSDDDHSKPSTSNSASSAYTALELARQAAAMQQQAAPRVQRRTTSSQTGDNEQLGHFIADEIRTKAVFNGLRKDESAPLSGAMSSRLFLTQKTLLKQMKEISQLRSERDGLRETLTKFATTIIGFRGEVMSDFQRLKDDVTVANREMKNFSIEMQNEANKDIRLISKIKEEIAKRIDDTDRYRRKIEASLDYQQALTKEAENQANIYHRASAELEQKIFVAHLEAKDAKEKLDDKIYLTNNAKCAHCQVNDRIKEMMTEQIAEKTLSANNLGKERVMLSKKLENSEKIAAIVSKENQKLKFELKAWESNCHRMKAELQALRGNHSGVVVLPPSLPPAPISIGEAAFTPKSTSKDTDGITPERAPLDDGMEEERPPATASNASANSVEEGEYNSPSPNTLAKLPPPPAPPAKLKDPSPEVDNAFAAWIPKVMKEAEKKNKKKLVNERERTTKERKPQEMPNEMAEAMRRVGEALEKGPPPKRDKRENERGEREKGKRSAGSMPSHHTPALHKNGEKKAKMDDKRKKVEVPPPPPRPIPSLSTKGQQPTAGILQKMAEREKEKRAEERKKKEEEPSPVPYSSTHEPAFPAVVAPKKAVTVPYNGPSTLMAAASSSSSSATPAPAPKYNNKTPEKKAPMNFLPVAGSTGMLPPPALAPTRKPAPIPLPMDAILREAERLRDIERERELRRERERERERERQIPPPRNDPYYDYEQNAAAAERRERMQPAPAHFDFDDDLPWNRGRTPQPAYQRPGRSRTPTQDWFYDAASAGHAPPPRQPSPRFFDEPRGGHPPPRDAYGRPMEMDYGRHPQQHPPQPLMQQPLAPPLRGPGGPPPGDVWRRDWHEPNWSEEPPRRSYWE